MEAARLGEHFVESQPPTVQEVLDRPFHQPTSLYRVAAALITSDGPLKDILPQAAQAPNKPFGSSLRVALSDKQCRDIIGLVSSITGKNPDDYQVSVRKSGDEIVDEEQRTQYVRQLESGIALFVENGYLHENLVQEIRQKLLDPAKTRIIDRNFSDFSQKDYDFPTEPLGITLSPYHVANVEERIKKYLGVASLEGKLDEKQTHAIATQMALMHEFGHGVSSFIITSITQKLAHEANVDFSQLPHQQKWEFYVKAHDMYYQMTKEAAADGRDALLKDIFSDEDEKGENESTYSEGVSVGAENIALALGLRSQGLTEEEVDRVMTITKKQYEEKVSDFLYLANAIKHNKLGQHQYQNVMGSVYGQLIQIGYDIGNALPSFDGKYTGYSLPVSQDGFKRYTDVFQDMLFPQN